MSASPHGSIDVSETSMTDEQRAIFEDGVRVGAARERKAILRLVESYANAPTHYGKTRSQLHTPNTGADVAALLADLIRQLGEHAAL